MENINIENLLLANTPTIKDLAESHPARIYCVKRAVLDKYFSELYYVEDLYNWALGKEDYIKFFKSNAVFEEKYHPGQIVESKTYIKIDDSYKNISVLLFPSRSKNNELKSFFVRYLAESNHEKRFLQIKILDFNHCYFGVNWIDFNKKIIITEGLFDTLSIENSFCVYGVLNIKSLLNEHWFKEIDKKRIVFIIDHDINNWLIYSWSIYLTENGYRLCYFPFWFKKFDLNDLAQNKITKQFLEIIIYFFSLLPPKLTCFLLKVRWRLINMFKFRFS